MKRTIETFSKFFMVTIAIGTMCIPNTNAATARSTASKTTASAKPVAVNNKTSKFEEVIADTGAKTSDTTSSDLAERVRRQRALLDNKGNTTQSTTAATSSGVTGANSCDATLRKCMAEKCGSDFTKCAGDSTAIWGDKMDSCRRKTKCTGHEYSLLAPEILADRDFNQRMSYYQSVINCGNRYNSCIFAECGATLDKCLAKSDGDRAVSKCASIARDCKEQDSGLAARVMTVFGDLRTIAQQQVKKDESRLYELRDLMRNVCNRFGAMLDDRTLDCVYTVNFFAGDDTSSPVSSKKLYAGDSFQCNANWFGIDVTTFKENAYRLTRSQTSASSAMLGAGVGVAAGLISSGAIDRALETQNARKAAKEECENSGYTWEKDTCNKDKENEDIKKCQESGGTWENGKCKTEPAGGNEGGGSGNDNNPPSPDCKSICDTAKSELQNLLTTNTGASVTISDANCNTDCVQAITQLCTEKNATAESNNDTIFCVAKPGQSYAFTNEQTNVAMSAALTDSVVCNNYNDNKTKCDRYQDKCKWNDEYSTCENLISNSGTANGGERRAAETERIATNNTTTNDTCKTFCDSFTADAKVTTLPGSAKVLHGNAECIKAPVCLNKIQNQCDKMVNQVTIYKDAEHICTDSTAISDDKSYWCHVKLKSKKEINHNNEVTARAEQSKKERELEQRCISTCYKLRDQMNASQTVQVLPQDQTECDSVCEPEVQKKCENLKGTMFNLKRITGATLTKKQANGTVQYMCNLETGNNKKSTSDSCDNVCQKFANQFTKTKLRVQFPARTNSTCYSACDSVVEQKCKTINQYMKFSKTCPQNSEACLYTCTLPDTSNACAGVALKKCSLTPGCKLQNNECVTVQYKN